MSEAFSTVTSLFRLPAFETPEKEAAFLAWDDASKLGFRTLFLLLATLLYAAIAVLDVIGGGDAVAALLAVRGMTVVAMIGLLFLFTRDCSPKRREVLLHLFGMIVVVSIVIKTLIGTGAIADFYPFLLSATMIFASALIMPRFHALALSALATNLIYWPSTFFASISAAALYTNVIVMGVTSFAIVVGAYAREKMEREQAIFQDRLGGAREDALLARDDAIRANQAKSHLLANVSHELRTPMNAILGFSEIMKHEMFGPMEQPQYRDYSHDIFAAATLLQSSINDLLDVSRLEVNKMSWEESWVPLSTVIDRAINTCAVEAQASKIRLVAKSDESATLMLCDPERMAQVLINLVTNALKFSETGTTVTVAYASGVGFTTLSVSDQGCGIAAEDIERICEPFGQIESNSMTAQKGGMGLGLSIVRGLTSKFDGRLEIDSTLGKGTTVSLIIPAERIAQRPNRFRIDKLPPAPRLSLVAS